MTPYKVTKPYRVLVALFMLLPQISHSWEVGTHARLTKQSYLSSMLEESKAGLQRLGLNEGTYLRHAYFDADQSSFERRITSERLGSAIVIDANDPLKNNMPASNIAGKIVANEEEIYRHSPVGWLMRGAIREDDIGRAGLSVRVEDGYAVLPMHTGENPQDDPYAPPHIWRVMRHFYDPFNHTGFIRNLLCIQRFKQFTGDVNSVSPDSFAGTPNWALGVEDAFADDMVEAEERRNHFTILDAREAMYRALTGTDKDGSDDIGPESMTDAQIRRAYWATTFRSLGDVLHLVQDMAQPQHTRNDPHSGIPCFGDAAAIESYTEARAEGRLSVELSDLGIVSDLKPVDYGEYPVPSFGRYSDYFSTAQRSEGSPTERVANGNGIADYSHRGFFTSGKNLGNEDYPLPVNNTANYERGVVTIDLAGDSKLEHETLRGEVHDKLQNITESAALTSFGVFDDFLLDFGYSSGYSMAPVNYEDNADLLLPRAVSYGAGLINYFFRGRIGLAADRFFGLIDHATPHSLNDEGVPIKSETGEVFGFEKIKLRVRNDTPDIVPTDGSEPIPQEMNDGFLQAVIKYSLNHCYKPDLTGQFSPDELPVFPGTARMATVSTRSGCNGVNYLVKLPENNEEGNIRASTLQELVEFKEHVAISKRIPIGEGHDIKRLPSSDFKPVDFDFRDDPIPVNARDIKLQILYRGKLGSGNNTENDAVVVTTVDIPEPTYITFTNSLDYTYANGHFLAHNAAVSALETIVSQLRSSIDQEDRTKADNLERNIRALSDPSIPITDLSCEDQFGEPGLITVDELNAKRYIRIVALTNTSESTFFDLCRYTATLLNGNVSRRLLVYIEALVNQDYYDRAQEFFHLEGFAKMRGVAQKQGSPDYYDDLGGLGVFGWSAVYNSIFVSEEELPPREPPQKVQEIPSPIDPEPVPVNIRCDYVWKDCATESG